MVGEQLQTPPAFSAKKISGRRAYALARAAKEIILAPVPVAIFRIELIDYCGDRAIVRLTSSAGFYVRAFAHTLGERLGTGACLEALRRTRVGEFGLDTAISLESLRQSPEFALGAAIPLDRLLPTLPAARVTDEGRHRISHGRHLDASFLMETPILEAKWVRLVGADGSLLALARRGTTAGTLHPSVVLI
jgi:tRNA pseudouridine55 synthase